VQWGAWLACIWWICRAFGVVHAELSLMSAATDVMVRGGWDADLTARKRTEPPMNRQVYMEVIGFLLCLPDSIVLLRGLNYTTIGEDHE